jgi:signal transduction histidine kinase
MALRVRLALWYGALLAIVLAAGFTIAYLIHASFPHEGDAAFEASLGRLRLILFGVGAVGVALAVLGGWAISSGALRPIRSMIATARAIALSRGFSRRIDVRAGARDELAVLGRTFNEMLASLDEAYRRQQRFVADVSHELRTPLTAIQGDLELLSREMPERDRTATIAEALRETRRMARLVDDLLVLVRADAGPQPFSGRPVELDEVVMEVFRELHLQAGPRLEVVDLDEARVLGERDRLKQLVLILADNALRYAPNERVALSVGVDGPHAVLAVDDEGIGISPDVAARAFERFYRGEEAARLDPSGTGLGLAIARWIVERHGGSITLERREPRGTRALVRLPTIGPEAPPAARRS